MYGVAFWNSIYFGKSHLYVNHLDNNDRKISKQITPSGNKRKNQ